MTRINCIPVENLIDKHLIAEYMELPRISSKSRIAKDAPAEYKLGPGHMKFFYDKGEFLRRRFEEEIVPEMQRRGFKTNFTKYRMHPEGLNNDWVPTPEAIKISQERLEQRAREIKDKHEQNTRTR